MFTETGATYISLLEFELIYPAYLQVGFGHALNETLFHDDICDVKTCIGGFISD